MTEQRRKTIAYIQTEVSRICKLVEIEEWIIAPQIGIEGHYTPEGQKLYNKLLSQEGLSAMIQEWQDPEQILLEKCELETDKICTTMDIVQYIRHLTETRMGVYTPKAQDIFDDLWDRGH
mgnify:CR=1 FL=1